METELLDIARVDEHHAPTTLDAAVAIAVPVDRRIELVMTAHGLQDHMTRWHLQRLNRRHRELRAPGLGGEPTLVPRRMFHDKAARSGHVYLITVAARHSTSDMPADLTIVITHGPPVDVIAIAECRLGKRGDDRHLGPQMRTGGSQRSAGCVDRAGRV